MIKIFYGDDRIHANQEIKKLLGPDYEILEGNDISPADLPSIFYGASLFSPERKILIRDFTANKSIYEQLADYLDTPHDIVLLESKLDKRTATYKSLKGKLEFKEFKAPENPNLKLVFDIYRTAKTDGNKAIQMLAEIKPNEDPIKFTGLLISQSLKDFTAKQGAKEKATLGELSRLDIQMKSTKIDPWLLVESFLLRLPTI